MSHPAATPVATAHPGVNAITLHTDTLASIDEWARALPAEDWQP